MTIQEIIKIAIIAKQGDNLYVVVSPLVNLNGLDNVKLLSEVSLNEMDNNSSVFVKVAKMKELKAYLTNYQLATGQTIKQFNIVDSYMAMTTLDLLNFLISKNN